MAEKAIELVSIRFLSEDSVSSRRTRELPLLDFTNLHVTHGLPLLDPARSQVTLEPAPEDAARPELTQEPAIRDVVRPNEGGVVAVGMPSMTHLRRRLAVDLEFKGVSYSVPVRSGIVKKGHKIILNGLSGKFCSGELIGIIGSCGAGKSTLMDILAGMRKKGVEGQILVNGQPQKRRTFKKLSCYISQFHSLFPNLTVLESMMFTANMTVKETTAVKRDMVDEILIALHLKECTDIKTHKLSGGQMKLLSIALELLRNPSVMFLDEPTSGLDDVYCSQVVPLLKSLAQSGRTIVCTIHQPSYDILNFFDKLYILCRGQCIYDGTVSYLTTFLANFGQQCRTNCSPAALMLKEAAKNSETAPIFVRAVKSGMCTIEQQESITNAEESSSSDPSQCQITSVNMEDVDPMESDEFVNSAFTQFCALLKRSFISDNKQLNMVLLRFIVTILASILLGLVYLQIGNEAVKVSYNLGYIFFSLFITMAVAQAPTVLTFPLEMSVVLREHHNNWYGLKAYYLAKVMADIPFQVSCYPLEYPYDQTGTIITAWTVDVIMCIFSGFLGQFNELPSYVSWITYVSFIRYSFRGIVMSLYGMDRADLECAEGICPLQKPETILNEHKIYENELAIVFTVLVLYFLCLRLATYFVLCYKVRSLRRK
ncbi:ABCG4 protein, partial [Polypterus senegalus]